MLNEGTSKELAKKICFIKRLADKQHSEKTEQEAEEDCFNKKIDMC